MSMKYLCDACGTEINGGGTTFSYPCHLDDPDTLGYVDSEGNAVSGRKVDVDLCNECCNRILSLAVEELKFIRTEKMM